MESQEIGGRYSVIERIGKGAMGVVFKAYDPVLDRVVAIKKMVAEIGQDEELRQRFYVEARAAARLNHRNIVTIHELEESEGEIYIVMEFLEGLDLATVIRRKVPLPLDAKLSIVSQLCEGLDYAHRHGIVHRDIKPGNVHLSPAGLVKILDFGIARLASSKVTGAGALLGTPDYMSPEQVLGEEVDARSDLFAVGGVLYELLASSKAFESDTVASLLIKIARNPHVPITDRVPDLPVSLVSLVNRLLAKNRDQRPASAGEVAAELRACLVSASGSDTAAAAAIGGIVTEQTIAIGPARPLPPGGTSGTPRPPGSRPRSTPPRDLARGVPSPQPSAASSSASGVSASESSNARLASLALQRGRELRMNGDLAGAIEVFRSVLEVAPGNAEALEELQALERDIRQATARPKVQPGGEVGATVVKPRGDTGVGQSATAHPVERVEAPATPPAAPPLAAVAAAPAATGRRGSGLAIAATLLVVIVAAAGSGYYLLIQTRGRTSLEGSPSVTSSAAAPQTATPAATSSAPVTSSVPAATVAQDTAAPSTKEAKRPADDAVERKPESPQDADRVRADVARHRLDAVKRASLSRRPPPLRLRREFIKSEREANAAYNRGDYATAAAAFETAARTMESAGERGAVNADAPSPPASTSEAAAAPPRQNEPRKSEPPPRPAAVSPPDRSDDTRGVNRPPTRDSSPGDIGAFNRSAPRGIDQMFSATPSTAATVARIKDLLERYTNAVEHRDMETLRASRSELNPLEQRIVRQGKEITYKLDDVSVQSNGQEGIATGRRIVSVQLESGEKINMSGPVTVHLVRRPAGWLITEIR